MNVSRQDIHFTKMHGLGNDFVVLDLRERPDPDSGLCRFLADRRRGIGCDLILGVAAPHAAESIASYRIWTPTGRPSQQCGNGARCIAAWVVRAGLVASDRFSLDSPRGTHTVDRFEDNRFRVALGVPDFSPSALPLQGYGKTQDDYSVAIDGMPEMRFSAVSMGNPHAVIEVDDIDAVPVVTLGRSLRETGCLPDDVNVGFVQLVTPTHLRLRVDEFGAGETLACGSGACAAAAALIRRGRARRDVIVSLAGGDLHVSWPSPISEITMTGTADFVFEGTVPTAIIAALEESDLRQSPQPNTVQDPEIDHG